MGSDMHPFDADCILPILTNLQIMAPFLGSWVDGLKAKHRKNPNGQCECGHQPPVQVVKEPESAT